MPLSNVRMEYNDLNTRCSIVLQTEAQFIRCTIFRAVISPNLHIQLLRKVEKRNQKEV